MCGGENSSEEFGFELESWPKLKFGDPCADCVDEEIEPNGSPLEALAI
jgi:hypothetical protein